MIARSRRFVVWLARSHYDRQVLTIAGLTVLCWFTVRPIGTSGRGLAVLALLIVNTAVTALRLVPESRRAGRPEIVAVVVGACAAAGLLAASPTNGTPSLFAFFLTGYVGFRLPVRQAFAATVFTSGLCTAVLVFHIGVGHLHEPWYLGPLTGASVFIGLNNRNRNEAMRSARAAAEQATLAAQQAELAAASAEQAAASEARAVALAERGRIARDVHDVLAHSLAAVNMQLEVADALLDTGAVAEAQQATRRAQSLVREGMTEVRRTVQALREDSLPLVDTLRGMLADVTQGTGTLEVTGVPREVETSTVQTLVRCAQEALTNAARYAPGAAVRIYLGYAPGTCVLDVLNAAPARDATPLPGGSGMGLVGLRERVALLGGTVTTGPVTTGPDHGGWQVHVEVPA